MSPAQRRFFNPDREPRSGWERYTRDHPERAAFYKSPAWSFARTQQLLREPNCQAPGCVEAASHVDHIVPMAEGGAKVDPANLQSLCKQHHGPKTVQESHRGRRRVAELAKHRKERS